MSIVTICAGGESFYIARDYLVKFSDCYFAACLRRQPDSETITIDRNPAYLGIVLDWLRTGEVIIPNTIDRRSILLEAQYLGLEKEMFPEGRRLRLRWQNKITLDANNAAVGPIALVNKKGSTCEIKLVRLAKHQKRHHIEICSDSNISVACINTDLLKGTKLCVDPGPWYVYLRRGTLYKPIAEPIAPEERVQLIVTHVVPCDEDEIQHVVSS